ncbi:MAG TPA: MBL fold metallo-hydrolase [Bryobacteraceae bacterium]|nr:MBL fold metallo-hydrolase [Bryobacteraceae bacterium]
MPPRTEASNVPSEVLPGVFRVKLPLPFELSSINVYLVRLREGYLLVDCGMDTKASFDTLARALETAGAGWTDIREILLTHVHPDHMGLAPRLLKLTKAQLWMHAEDAEFLEQLADYEPYREWSADVLRDSGVPEKVIMQIGAAAEGIHQNFRRLDPDCILVGGERIATAIGELEVVWTPGHSPGHVCLYARERRVLFSGDQMLEFISPNIGWHPGRDPLGEFLDSLAALSQLDIDLILPSHGAPFSGHREWIQKTVDHHADRCARILALLERAPKAAAALADSLWENGLTPFHYRFAVFEVLAHLEYLERQGKVARLKQDGVSEWRVA